MYSKNFLIFIILTINLLIFPQPVSQVKISFSSYFQAKDNNNSALEEKEKLLNLVDILRKRTLRRSGEIKEFVSYLFQSGRFSKIDTTELAENRIKLFPKIFIKEIDLIGYSPFFKNNLLKLLPTKEFSYIGYENISKAKIILTTHFRENGYEDCLIEEKIAKFNNDPGFDIISLEFKVKKNSNYYKTGEISFKGNSHYSDFRLRYGFDLFRSKIISKLIFSNSDVFKEKILEKDLRDLKKFYQEEGYGKVAISARVEADSVSFEKNIKVSLDEGPKIIFHFTGNEEITDTDIEDIIENEGKNMENNRGLYSVISAIKNLYHKNGFKDADIQTEKFLKEDEEIYSLKITEGDQYFTSNVTIKADFFSDKQKLSKYMNTQKDSYFSSQILAEDLANLRNYLINQGFNDIIIIDSIAFSNSFNGKINTKVVLNFKNTKAKKISLLNYESPLNYKSFKKKLKLKQNGFFSEILFYKDIETLKNSLGESGFPYAEVKADFKTDSAGNYKVFYRLVTGNKIKKQKSIVFGLHKSSLNDISFYESRLEDDFNLINLYRFQNNIRKLQTYSFSSFKVLGLNERDSLINQLIYVEEIKPYFVKLDLGYYSDIGFSTKGEVGDRIFLGGNRILTLTGKYSVPEQAVGLNLKQFRIGNQEIEQTYYIDYKTEDELSADIQYQEFSTGLKFRYFQNKNTIITLNLGYLSGKTTTAEEEEVSPYLFLKPGITWDYRDSSIKPKKGWKFYLGSGYNHNTQNNLKNYFELKTEFSICLKIFKNLILVPHGNYQSYFHDDFAPFKSSDQAQLSADKLLFGGGLNDVRGYTYHELYTNGDNEGAGGYHFLFGNIELRWEFFTDVELAIFSDLGQIRDLAGDVQAGSWKKTAGLALRYLTPLGPIGLAYGYKLDKLENEDPGAFHFHIGYSF